MKKLSKILFLTLFSFLLLSCGKQVTEEEAAQALSKYLVEEYGEEFEIGGIMRTQTPNGEEYFEADIILSRYYNNGQDDEYFWRLGQVAIEKSPFGEKIKYATDTYGIVRVNLSANEYFMPKLKELFGKQVLPIFQIKSNVVSRKGDFIKTMELNEHATIGGGIYLFGRIDNLEEKEVYREKIFEFIQFMKEKGVFTKVDLAFYILDERCLTERFDREIGPKLVEAREELKTADEFINYRKEQMNVLNEDFNKMTEEEKLKRINKFDRMALLDIFGWQDKSNNFNSYSVLYHSIALSKKFLDVELRLKMLKKIDYNNLEEMKVYNTVKIDYEEYNEKEFYNHEWDGE